MSTQVIILAAGQGKRMGQNIPKVLTPLKGKPMILYLLEAIKKSKICQRPLVVIGAGGELVQKTLGTDYDYIFQAEQLGTGHAVSICKQKLLGKSKNVFVVYGDNPFLTSEFISELAFRHEKSSAVLTLATVRVDDFQDWRENFYYSGRIIRGQDGKIKKIVELKDCTEDEKAVKELNPSYFLFDAEWLWANIDNLKNNNSQKEYYLTDMLEIAILQNEKVAETVIDPKLAIGINTREQLESAEKMMYN